MSQMLALIGQTCLSCLYLNPSWRFSADEATALPLSYTLRKLIQTLVTGVRETAMFMNIHIGEKLTEADGDMRNYSTTYWLVNCLMFYHVLL